MDVNPNLLKLRVTQAVIDTFFIQEFPLPTSRLRVSGKGRASVIEIFKFIFHFPGLTALGNVAETNSNVFGTVSTSSHTAATAASTSGGVIYRAGRIEVGAFTAAGTYRMGREDPDVYDVTDGAGHGLLVATDSIFLSVGSANTGFTNVLDLIMLYRFKDVGITEYVGIVQSQN